MTYEFDDERLLNSSDEIPRGAFSVATAPDELRDRAWRATSGHLRRRRYFRNAKRFVAATALFAGGVVAGVLVTDMKSAKPLAAPSELTASNHGTNQELVPNVLLEDGEAFALRLRSASKDEQRALLRRAGDRYLNDTGQVQLALRCYKRMLEVEGPDAQYTIEANDSWLLMALKTEKQRESKYAQPSA